MSDPTEAADQQSSGGWLREAAVAAILTINVDGESTLLARDPTLASNQMLMSQQSFGPLVAVPRILRLLADVGVSATIFVPGLVAARYPVEVLFLLRLAEVGERPACMRVMADLVAGLEDLSNHRRSLYPTP